jgi:pimeloyl-ACP methyl ester carboxylesterase
MSADEVGFVSDLEAVVDAAGLERFALFGISQGCAVSIAYAVRHPERVTRLVLYGGFVVGVMKRARSRYLRVPRVASGHRLVESEANRVKVAVREVARRRDGVEIEVRGEVATRATATALLFLGGHGNVEVDDLRPAPCPQQVARLDVAVEDTVLMQVFEAARHVPPELERVLAIAALPETRPLGLESRADRVFQQYR